MSLDLPNPIVAMYHNITPEHFFEEPGAIRYSRLGREQLAYLARRSLFGVADSNYNRTEMLAAGFRRVDVLPVWVDYSEFEPAGHIAGPASTDWLFVGRVVPNKCQHLLIEAFATYARTFDPRARLHLVGGTSDEPYRHQIGQVAQRLQMEDRVLFRGKVSDRELQEAFARAGVYVSLSDHEGFGVPLLEAMAARVPVVAFGSSAVPETIGGAGILLRTQDPATVAATVESLRTDPGLRARLIDRQTERLRRVASFDVPRALRRLVDRAEGQVPPLEIQVQGPFETSYSLATMNRKLALGLDRLPGVAVSLYPTEGPGDYVPAATDLTRHPEVVPLWRRSVRVPYPDVVDPPDVATPDHRLARGDDARVLRLGGEPGAGVDGRGLQRLPRRHRRDLDLRGRRPAGLGGDGADPGGRQRGRHPRPRGPGSTPPSSRDRSGFTFLHISSAFPRKGVDVLLRAYFAAFTGSDDVDLVLKTFPNPHNGVGGLLDDLRDRPRRSSRRPLDRP